MFNVGGGELLVILLVALIVLGPQRLPGAARQVGRVMGDLRRISNGFQQELQDAFDPDDRPSRPAEPVPLARAVADADTQADAPGPGTPALREVTAAGGATAGAAGDAGHAKGVAPVVARALDEIVPPASPPTGADGDQTTTSATDGAADAAAHEGDVGDERAAS